MTRIKVGVALIVGLTLGYLVGSQFGEPNLVPPKPIERKSDMYSYNATVLRIVDGDTMWAKVDLGFRISRDISLRFEGIDAPEMNTDAGKKSKLELAMLIPIGSRIRINTYRDPDAYDRYTAKVFIQSDDGSGLFSVNDWLVEQGLAVYKKY